MCPFAKLALILKRIPESFDRIPEIFNISRAAKSRSSAVCAAQCKREESVTRIPTHENLLTSVPTQNVDSAELTDIKRILNVLLKKKVAYVEYVLIAQYEIYEDGSRMSRRLKLKFKIRGSLRKNI